MTITWDEYFFGIADAVAKKSHCLSRQVGAVAVLYGKFVVATGYNGPPAGYPHCDTLVALERLARVVGGGEKTRRKLLDESGCPRRNLGYVSGQGLELCPAAHAERNVLIEAARLGITLEGCVLYLTCSWPCRECAKEMVNAGIVEVVVTGDEEYMVGGLTGRDILGACGVQVRIGR